MFNKRTFMVSDADQMGKFDKLIKYLKYNEYEWAFSMSQTKNKENLYVISWYS
jgi:hypothetical protein